MFMILYICIVWGGHMGQNTYFQNVLCSYKYRVFYDLWTLLQEVISQVFVIKKFIETCVRFWTITEL